VLSGLTHTTPAVLAAFLASFVEFVEALTIVLAAGLTRGWRSALLGALCGALLLAALVVGMGPGLRFVPLALLQIAAGLLLLLFGMRWLQKAILRAAGRLPFHDETKIFASQAQVLSRQAGAGAAIDAIGFLTSFKGVLIEGAEVVFVVLTVGAAGGLLLPASVGAISAGVMVMLLGIALHRPLSRVPENLLKFAVGVLLSAFGLFWFGEGAGIRWPGGDLMVLTFLAIFLLAALATVLLLKRSARAEHVSPLVKE
jgi:uncharacterized membrane protein